MMIDAMSMAYGMHLHITSAGDGREIKRPKITGLLIAISSEVFDACKNMLTYWYY